MTTQVTIARTQYTAYRLDDYKVFVSHFGLMADDLRMKAETLQEEHNKSHPFLKFFKFFTIKRKLTNMLNLRNKIKKIIDSESDGLTLWSKSTDQAMVQISKWDYESLLEKKYLVNKWRWVEYEYTGM